MTRFIIGPALLAMVMFVAAAHVAGQAPRDNLFPSLPTISTVPHQFLGTWHGDPTVNGDPEFSGNCGSLKDHYGNPRELCGMPVDRLENFMNGRMRAWIQFYDETLSQRWTCVAGGLHDLAAGYLIKMSSTPSALLQSWEQSNWVRTLWMDGRPHAPATEAYYHGHSLARVVSPTEIVVDTTNFTFDPDGWDDHSHLATSQRKHQTERYLLTGPNTLTLEITIDDPVFLKSPFTWKRKWAKTRREFINSWDCDPQDGLEELYRTIPQRYPDDTEFQKYK